MGFRGLGMSGLKVLHFESGPSRVEDLRGCGILKMLYGSFLK